MNYLILNDQKIFGRKKEIQEIFEKINSEKAEFIAVYGKRRIGKTFLINNICSHFANRKEKCLYLKLTGQINLSKSVLLKRAFIDLEKFVLNNNIPVSLFKKNLNSWMDFLTLLEEVALICQKLNITLLIFIDEIAWIADKRGEFLSSFALSWNQTFINCDNVKMFVSGSATNWIVKKILQNKGGLHRRLTHLINLQSFSFSESSEYLKYHNPNISDYNCYLHYLVFGGVPYYLSLYDFNNSLEQNIKTLFSGLLKNEFEEILSSLFKEKNPHKDILLYLVENTQYKQKDEIINHIAKYKKCSNQTISNCLEELVLCGFIKERGFFKNKIKGNQYRINDNFIYFYIKIINKNNLNDFFNINSQSFVIWSGYAFEIFLSNQINLIKEKLGISEIKTIDYCWNSKKYNNLSDQNCQIDLIIERADNIIHIVEAKFYNDVFNFGDDYKQNLENKLHNFQSFLNSQKGNKKKDLNLVLISLFGCRYLNKNKPFIFKNLSLINGNEQAYQIKNL